jgi:hypothetical protein
VPSPRKKALEDFAKGVERGVPLSEDYIGKSKSVLNDALRARDLSEEALAQKVLDNTGIPIPDKRANLSKKEDFLNRILKERYPELDSPVEFADLRGRLGEFGDNKILLNKNLARDRDVVKQTADLLHEGGHAFDAAKNIAPEKLDDFNRELRKLQASGFDLKNADPSQVYELISKKHHAQIPGLREGSFSLGALKNYLKTGTFKALPFVGPALGAASALSSGDLSAAIPILNEAESLGPEKGSAEYTIENPRASAEARRAALESMLKK